MRPVILGFAAFGFVFLAIGAGILLVQWRFRRQTVVTQGTIVAVRARAPVYPGNTALGYGLLYHPAVRFVTADGQRIEAESRTGANPPRGQVGQTVTIRYDPTTPQRFSVTSASMTAGCIAWAFVVMGGLVFGISCAALVASMNS
jgi:uncharacterized protein DUF3592